MTLIARVSKHPFVRAASHSEGWLPKGAAQPLATRALRTDLDVSLVAQLGGVLLMVESAEPTLNSDTWYASVREAKLAALEEYQVPLEAWRHVALSFNDSRYQSRFRTLLDDLCSKLGFCEAPRHFHELNLLAGTGSETLVEAILRVEGLDSQGDKELRIQVEALVAQHLAGKC